MVWNHGSAHPVSCVGPLYVTMFCRNSFLSSNIVDNSMSDLSLLCFQIRVLNVDFQDFMESVESSLWC